MNWLKSMRSKAKAGWSRQGFLVANIVCSLLLYVCVGWIVISCHNKSVREIPTLPPVGQKECLDCHKELQSNIKDSFGIQENQCTITYFKQGDEND